MNIYFNKFSCNDDFCSPIAKHQTNLISIYTTPTDVSANLKVTHLKVNKVSMVNLKKHSLAEDSTPTIYLLQILSRAQ